jgi:hypothetical protein
MTMRPYSSSLDHLDDVAEWAALVFDRAATPTERRASVEGALAARVEQVEARLAATRASGEPLQWDRLRVALALKPSEQAALLLLVCIELVPKLRSRMRAGDAARIWPDIGLLSELVYDTSATRRRLLDDMASTASLFRLRLVEVVGSARQVEDAPFLARPLRVAPRVLEIFYGTWLLDREVAVYAGEMSATNALVFEPALIAEAAHLLRTATQLVVLCGREGSGRKSLAAQVTGGRALCIRSSALPTDGRELTRAIQCALREARLFGLLPILDRLDELVADDSARGERAMVLDRALAGFDQPIAATAARADRAPLQLARGVVLMEVPPPSEATRLELWRRALPAAAPEVCAHAAARYPITGGMIERSAAVVRARAAHSSAEIVDLDLHSGVRATLDSKLGSLGTRITVTQTWNDLVLPEETTDEVRELLARVQHRKQVHDEWGFADKLGRGLGLSALFAGPPGTGKSMVAGLIGNALGLDVYQIDLSRIVSKWIGETEKNLGQVFEAAEAGHAILLFDEADSLFAKRTEVKSSVDRYANLEVNYLLQRMEAFQGISILTTNLEASIDEAFRRRLSARVAFPMPEAEERLRLWQALVPAKAAVANDVEFNVLADRYEMSGGYIRNAILRAAFLAAAEGAPINMRHLTRSASLEYAAMGKVMHGSL